MLSTTGCLTNYYEKYYDDYNKDAAREYISHKSDIILRTVTSQDDIVSILEDGYEPIGRSSFCATYTPLSLAVDTAYDHGASLVLADIRFKKRKQYTSLIYLPSYSISNHSGTLDGLNYSGTSATTTINPVSVQQSASIYVHDVVFFKKTNVQEAYGIYWQIPKRLPTEKIDAPIKVHVLAVLHGSQAERDNIKRGQLVKRINGKEIITRADIVPFLENETLIMKVEVEDEK